MYDELIKRLRELASIPEHCEKVDDCDKCSKEDICLSYTNKRIIEVETKAADAIEELLSERDEVNADSWKRALEVERDEHRWVPVEERLPTVDEEVIVFAYGSMMRIWSLHRLDQETADVCWECEDGTWDDVCVVTHWMPLPEPPKEETK